MMKGESGISLCDTCSNCECVFQSGVIRDQCAFYKKKIQLASAADWVSVGHEINQGISDGLRDNEDSITQEIKDFIKKEYEAVKKDEKK